jgi:hypothetical protein
MVSLMLSLSTQAALNRTLKAAAGRPVRHCGSVEIGWLRQGWLPLLGGLIVPWSAPREAEDTMRLMFGKRKHLQAAAASPSSFEQAVEDAVSHLKRRETKRYGNEVFETETLDGWRSWSDKNDAAPDQVRRAVENAIPAAFHDRC